MPSSHITGYTVPYHNGYSFLFTKSLRYGRIELSKETGMKQKTKVLFICTANQMRSKTAETIYRDDPRFEVTSAGTSTFATKIVDDALVTWADIIVVMEQRHQKDIYRRFSHIIRNKTVLRLDIPDRYQYMDPFLVREIKQRFEYLYTGES